MTETERDALPPAVRELYPWAGSYLEVKGGHRLHYLDEGQGPPVVMVHGNPTWSFYYRDLVKELSRDHRCVVPDHIGCGLSDKPDDWGYHIGDHVDNLVALVEHLGLQEATLVVHDWGGAIGYAAAARLKGVFKRFVVMNTAAFLRPLPASLRLLRLPLYGPLVVQGFNGFFKMGWGLATGRKERFTPAVRQGYLFPYGTWRDRKVIMRFIQEIPLEQEHPSRWLIQGLADGLPELRPFPHLIFWGMKDPVFHPGYLEEWRARFPEAEVYTFDDAGHWVLDEVPDRIIPRIRAFLDENPIPASAP
ncbi:MAG: alpha/beta fold hydrolase [Deltaproteobacteria bacterium]|nr:alpha/beta fold hydrolase [Deltaproteobacteria bacterium]